MAARRRGHATIILYSRYSATATSTRQNRLPNAVRLFRTDDGGRHWQVLPRLRPDTSEHIGSLTFVSEDAGWLEIIRGAGAGSVAFDLYRTVDGGMHWLRGPRVQSPRLSPAVPLG